MAAEIVTAEVVVVAEAVRQLRHCNRRGRFGGPAVIDGFRRVLGLMSVTNLKARFKGSEVRTDMIIPGVGCGRGQVQLGRHALGGGEVFESPVGGVLQGRASGVTSAEGRSIGIGLRRRIVVARD